MASNAPKILYGPAALTNADVLLWTPPATKIDIVTLIHVVNTDGAAGTVKVGIDGTTDAKLIWPPQNIPAYGVADLDESFPLDAAVATQILHALASRNSAYTLTVTGYTRTP